jgi:hypothetical protein
LTDIFDTVHRLCLKKKFLIISVYLSSGGKRRGNHNVDGETECRSQAVSKMPNILAAPPPPTYKGGDRSILQNSIHF